MNLKHKQFLAFGVLFLMLVGIPALTYLSQKNQESRSRANASTSLYFAPSTTSSSPTQKNVGDTVSYDVMIDPGTNLPSIIKLQLNYDTNVLQTIENGTFTANTAAFPTTLEGPVFKDNSVYISVSIGSDSTKAIQTVTKVGTITFQTKYPTTAPSVISFGPNTQVLSVAKQDQSNENVLSTTTPAYLTIHAIPSPTYIAISPTNMPTTTPYPNPTMTPTDTPYLTPTDIPTAYPTTTNVPTETPTPTPTPPASSTVLAFSVYMHGIGNSGDNASPNQFSLSNKMPQHPTRDMTVSIYDASNQLVTSVPGSIVYDATNGYFTGTVDLGNIITVDGLYTVKIQSRSHLRRIINGIQTLQPSKLITMPTATLVAGDVNGDNFINIVDYNMLIGCYSDLQAAISCDDSTKILTDLNDDNAVNQIDYNLFLREITVQNGN